MEATSPRTVGEEFVHFLAAKDALGLKSLMGPAISFRAVTPGRCWEEAAVDQVVDRVILGTWFAPDRVITGIAALETGHIGSIERIRYQLMVDRPEGEFVVEQQAYLEIETDKIVAARISCSGYVPR